MADDKAAPDECRKAYELYRDEWLKSEGEAPDYLVWQAAWHHRDAEIARLRGIEPLIRHARSLCTFRYQAYEYVEEGEPGYAAAGDLARKATAYLKKLDVVLERIEQALSPTQGSASGEMGDE